jgi:hypothetical protein
MICQTVTAWANKQQIINLKKKKLNKQQKFEKEKDNLTI